MLDCIGDDLDNANNLGGTFEVKGKKKNQKIKGTAVFQTVSQPSQQARPSPRVAGAKCGKPKTRM